MIAKRCDRPRRGMLAIAVLVCLLVLTIIGLSLVRTGTAQRDGVRALGRRLQAEWLAEAGLRRALARLDLDPGYSGETWNIEARDLGAADAATVAITIERPSGNAESRTIRVRGLPPGPAPPGPMLTTDEYSGK